MISPLRGRGRRLFFQTLALLTVVLLATRTCAGNSATTVATFNIEEFPKSDAQVDGAFDTIDDLSAPVVALQEITDRARFDRAAADHLAGNWRTVFPDDPPEMSPGILYDADRLELVDHRAHPETIVYEGARPVLEVELRPRTGGRRLDLFVVHLKAGGDGVPIRREQHRALRDILDDHGEPGPMTVLLGDFNSTDPQDRKMLRTTADHASLRWLSRRNECTGYWIPDDECRSFDLDHILADGLAARALSRGPCETVGCEPGDRCPVFHRRVSDHCPLTATLVPGR